MKKILACMLAVLMLAALVACGSKGSGSSSPLAGTWKLTKARVSGVEVTAEQMGQSISFTFNADGTATMTANGESQDGLNWELKDDVVKLSVQGMNLYDLNYDGSTLTLVEPSSGAELIFER